MFHSRAMGGRSQPPHVQQWRDVLNTHWPDNPRDFTVQPTPRRVRVRIVWGDEHGVAGEVWLAGTATRWDTTHVYVRDDSGGRLAGQGVWVKPIDVYQATSGSAHRDSLGGSTRTSPSHAHSDGRVATPGSVQLSAPRGVRTRS